MTVRKSANPEVAVGLDQRYHAGQSVARPRTGNECPVHIAAAPYTWGMYVYYPQGQTWLCAEGQTWNQTEKVFRSPCICNYPYGPLHYHADGQQPTSSPLVGARCFGEHTWRLECMAPYFKRQFLSDSCGPLWLYKCYECCIPEEGQTPHFNRRIPPKDVPHWRTVGEGADCFAGGAIEAQTNLGLLLLALPPSRKSRVNPIWLLQREAAPRFYASASLAAVFASAVLAIVFVRARAARRNLVF